MPIYEYDCAACGRRIEVMHSVNGTGPSVCESCGGTMKKALSLPAIHFKGSGWAKKDARSSAAPASTAAKKDDAPATTGGETAAPATTPAPAPAAPAPAATPASGTTAS